MFGLPAYVHSDRGSSFLSKELKDWLHSKGVVTSRSTPYNPRGNGQVERFNDIIWTTVKLALSSKQLSVNQWEMVLLDAMHCIRTLITTATNETPHERLFSYQRRSATGTSMPSWLMSPGKVFIKKHGVASKYDSQVEEVELLEANPNYAHIRDASGVEKTVSLRDIAPHTGNSIQIDNTANLGEQNLGEQSNRYDQEVPLPSLLPVTQEEPAMLSDAVVVNSEPTVSRRSSRISKPPNRLDL